MRSRTVQGSIAIAATASLALAACGGAGGPQSGGSSKLTDGKVVIGLLNDQSGVYKDLSGPNSKVAIDLAIADYQAKYGEKAVAKTIEVVATEKAVWKPKLWSIYMMSLSIVFGMPTTAIFEPRSAISWAIRIAPRIVPSPPMTNRALIFIRSRQSTISTGSCSPREVPRIVPPFSLIPETKSGVRSRTPRRYLAMNP